MLTRREFGALTIGGVLVRLKTDTTVEAAAVDGVHLGVQTYSFRDLPRPAGAADSVDVVIAAMKEAGVGDCELFGNQLEPRFPGSPTAREALRTWRVESSLDHFRNVRRKFDAAGLAIHAYCYNMNSSFTDAELDHFRNVRRKFDAAGLAIHAYCYNMNSSFTDAELDRGFEMTKALGVNVMTTSTTMDVAKRLAPMADRHEMTVGLHGHSDITNPNEFATPESFAAAMKLSKHFKVNLDIGHFTAANYDAVAYIREHHAHITNLHLKDRKKNQGDNLPWGQGDTPIREVLQLLKKERWPIPADIEYEYKGAGTSPQEVKTCMAFARQALA